MSVVERALEKLRQREASTGGSSSDTIARLSRLSLDEIPSEEGDTWNGSARSFIEFDLSTLGRAGLYSGQNSRLADEYRLIKRALLKRIEQSGQIAQSAPGNLLMVTSSLPGEGKTFTSVNLSLSLAKEKDWRVLLVDADCKNPQLSRLLGVTQTPGLLDSLRDPDVPVESVILGTNVEGLSVLPLGSADDQAAELVASARMQVLCRKLAKVQNQIVVFDSPPLLLTTESVILSSHVGQIAFVVRANSTPQSAVLEAIEKLDVDNKAIGLVLNRADQGGESMGYGTYAAYGSYSAV